MFKEEVKSHDHIELIANFQGNDSIVLFSRLKNPVIKSQIIDLIYNTEQEADSKGVSMLLTSTDDHGVTTRTPKTPRSREEIEKDYEYHLEQAEDHTDIKFSDTEYPNMFKMVVGKWLPWGDGSVTTKQMSIVEAHEKGHSVRSYMADNPDLYTEHFQAGFDPSAVVFSDEYIEIIKKVEVDHTDNEAGFLVKEHLEYLFSGSEIAERMSQLKNYFGITDEGEFTKEHLDYARNHYVIDTGMDNGMTHFFQAITPEKEADFLRIINTFGI
jgi:hypothetical protein